jgi:hypothetical protein
MLVVLFGEMRQKRQRFHHGAFTYPAASDFPEQASSLQYLSIAARGSKVNETNGLLFRAAPRTGNAGDRYR